VVRFFRVYQYVVPALLFPISYYLWLLWYDGDHRLVALTLSLPVLFAYIIPGIGTNWLRLWEFDTRWRLGRFRPHHGFVFGTASSLLALLCLEPYPTGPWVWEIARAGFIVGSVLALWNWIYDIYAIKAGFIIVYNRPHAEGAGPEAVATDYAPVVFGMFGACYGAAIRATQYVLVDLGRSDLFWWFFGVGNLVAMTVPVAAFVLHSYVRSGETGLRPHQGG
jgi:hypothetical protein